MEARPRGRRHMEPASDDELCDFGVDATWLGDCGGNFDRMGVYRIMAK